MRSCRPERLRWVSLILILISVINLSLIVPATAWTPPANIGSSSSSCRKKDSTVLHEASSSASETSSSSEDEIEDDEELLFMEFVEFLKETQNRIIAQVEEMDGSGKKFSKDPWGVFDENNENSKQLLSGGITRVLQGGDVVEKGACSLTMIRRGVLTIERAAAIRARQDREEVQPGDVYSAAALSIVFHSRSPMVPTFRSDVRIFVVQSQFDEEDEDDDGNPPLAWFGGGADLTPYYLFDEDVKFFHNKYKDLCKDNPKEFSYPALKEACDKYFYLPARSEHRGTGGIFFDDMQATAESMAFVKGVANSWVPSWFPIIEKRQKLEYTEKQKQWQLLRRGRYLEFNLLYDRGVKFGLANANPRVEGVMVSAPPLIAWEYNHEIEEGSKEERLMKILKEPIEWAD